jgi:hypothetical protein
LSGPNTIFVGAPALLKKARPGYLAISSNVIMIGTDELLPLLISVSVSVVVEDDGDDDIIFVCEALLLLPSIVAVAVTVGVVVNAAAVESNTNGENAI